MVATLKIVRVLLVFTNLRIVAFTHPRSMQIEFWGGCVLLRSLQISLLQLSRLWH